jgi:hypothetical protein
MFISSDSTNCRLILTRMIGRLGKLFQAMASTIILGSSIVEVTIIFQYLTPLEVIQLTLCSLPLLLQLQMSRGTGNTPNCSLLQ